MKKETKDAIDMILVLALAFLIGLIAAYPTGATP